MAGEDDGPRPSAATLWVIIASGTLTVMAGAILGPVVNLIGSELGVSQSLAGLIITTHGLFIVLTSPIAGAVVDRYGPRRPYVAGLILYGLAGGAGLVIDSFPLLLASRAVLGVAVAFVYSAVTVLIYNLYVGRYKDRVMGLRGSANSLGAAVWPLLGGALGTLTWHGPFGVYLVAVPLGLVAAATVPEPTRATVDGATGGGSAGGLRGIADTFRAEPLLVPVYGLFFVANLLLYAFVVYYPRVLATLGIESSFGIGWYLSALGLSGAVSAAAYGHLRGRLEYRALAVGAVGLWSAALPLAALAPSPLLGFLPVVLFGLGQGLAFPTVLLWLEGLVPADRQGQYSAYVAMVGYVGQFLSPIAFASVSGARGARAVFAVAALAVAAILAVLVGLTVVRRTTNVDADHT